MQISENEPTATLKVQIDVQKHFEFEFPNVAARQFEVNVCASKMNVSKLLLLPTKLNDFLKLLLNK